MTKKVVLIVAPSGMPKKDRTNYMKNVKRDLPVGKGKELRFAFGCNGVELPKSTPILHVIFDLEKTRRTESKTIGKVREIVKGLNNGSTPSFLRISNTGTKNKPGCKNIQNFKQVNSVNSQHQLVPS